MTQRSLALAAAGAVLASGAFLTAAGTPALAAGAGSVRFEVATTGDCSGLTFSGEGALPESDGGYALWLRDGDGDGVFTASDSVGEDPGGQDVQDVRIRVYASPLSLSRGKYLPVFQRDTPELTPAQEQVDAAKVTLIKSFGVLPTAGDRVFHATYRCAPLVPRGGVDAGGGGLARGTGAGSGVALPATATGIALLTAGIALSVAGTRRGRRR